MFNKLNLSISALCVSLALAGLTSNANAGCETSFHSTIITELDSAYQAQGRPEVNFDNLGKVKDAALSHLEANAGKWPKDVSFSTSVLDDYVSVYVNCDGKEVKSEWRPK